MDMDITDEEGQVGNGRRSGDFILIQTSFLLTLAAHPTASSLPPYTCP
jgi:hypothetical protein